MEGIIIIVIIVVLLLAGPILADGFDKRQDEISKRLAAFIAENYNDLVSGVTLDYMGTPINRYSKLTRYRYCYSYIVMTTSRSSGIYLADATDHDEEARNAKLTCQLITAFSGWWGIPWGIINSIHYLFLNGANNGTNDDTVGDLMQRMANAAYADKNA